MAEIELKAEKLSENDNTTNVEMSKHEIWLIKHLLERNNPKKIVEVGISAGGNTVNLLNWKDDDAQLFSVDLAEYWYRDNTKLSGFMADEVENKKNFKLYRGYDYLDVYDEIGDGIDFIVIDTVHLMPGEFLTFISALPQLKDGCIVVLHDIHLNMTKIRMDRYSEYETSEFCTGLLYGGVSSREKYSLKTKFISNIGAFVVDESTRDCIKDVFRILCARWYIYPSNLNLERYLEYVKEHYPIECYNLFSACLEMQDKFFTHKSQEKTGNASPIDDLKKENRALKMENEMMKSTISWKITKPLRHLSRLRK